MEGIDWPVMVLAVTATFASRELKFINGRGDDTEGRTVVFSLYTVDSWPNLLLAAAATAAELSMDESSVSAERGVVASKNWWNRVDADGFATWMLELACIKSAAVTLFAALAELGLLGAEALVGATVSILLVMFAGSLVVLEVSIVAESDD